jgi:predicted nuclease with TOPRIM domain
MSRVLDALAELENDLEAAQYEAARVPALQRDLENCQVENADLHEDLDALQGTLDEFIEYVETLTPGAWQAYLAIQKLEGTPP